MRNLQSKTESVSSKRPMTECGLCSYTKLKKIGSFLAVIYCHKDKDLTANQYVHCVTYCSLILGRDVNG